MIILFLIILFIVAGHKILKTKYEILGVMMCIIGYTYLTVHILAWSTSGYSYNKFVAKRNAFEQTLNESRENGNQYESAAIVKEVSAWNTRLAEYKYDNNAFFIKDYIDDRYETLEPIK